MLGDVFQDSSQVRLVGLAEADDRIIWQYAKAQDFVIVSHDADFADMAALYGPPPKVIWLRCGNQPTEMIERRLREHADAVAQFVLDNTANCWEIY